MLDVIAALKRDGHAVLMSRTSDVGVPVFQGITSPIV